MRIESFTHGFSNELGERLVCMIWAIQAAESRLGHGNEFYQPLSLMGRGHGGRKDAW